MKLNLLFLLYSKGEVSIMFEFINNEWVIAIVGAIVSGTILVPITYKITKILEKTKIPKEVKKCNKEILSILRKIVSEGEQISFDLIEVLTDSVSRSNNLKTDLMNTPQMFIQDLILDIYDSSYIPMYNKVEMTTKLQNLLDSDTRVKRVPQKMKWNKREISFLAVLLIISIVVLVSSLFLIFKVVSSIDFSSSMTNTEKDSEGFRLVNMIIIVIAVFTVYFGVRKIFSVNAISSFFGLNGEDDDMEDR